VTIWLRFMHGSKADWNNLVMVRVRSSSVHVSILSLATVLRALQFTQQVAVASTIVVYYGR